MLTCPQEKPHGPLAHFSSLPYSGERGRGEGACVDSVFSLTPDPSPPNTGARGAADNPSPLYSGERGRGEEHYKAHSPNCSKPRHTPAAAPAPAPGCAPHRRTVPSEPAPPPGYD